MKFARNESCPCGSEKKFKKCCELKPNPDIRDEDLRASAEEIDSVLKAAIEDFSTDEYIETYAIGMNQLKRFFGLNDAQLEEFMDSEFGQQQILEWMLFVTPVGDHRNYFAAQEAELHQKLGQTSLSLFIVDSGFGDFLVLQDLFTSEYHFVKLLVPKHLHGGDILTGRMFQGGAGKLLLSAYAQFRLTHGQMDELRRNVTVRDTKSLQELQPEVFSEVYHLAKRQDFALTPEDEHCGHHHH